jgi:hypothetical protein
VDDKPGSEWVNFNWSRSDFALLRRAVRGRWGVPDPLRTEALYQAARTLADPGSSYRLRLAASKLLLDADKHDLSEDKLDLERAKFEHATRPPETSADDFSIDLSESDSDPDDPGAGDPPQPGHPAAA